MSRPVASAGQPPSPRLCSFGAPAYAPIPSIRWSVAVITSPASVGQNSKPWRLAAPFWSSRSPYSCSRIAPPSWSSSFSASPSPVAFSQAIALAQSSPPASNWSISFAILHWNHSPPTTSASQRQPGSQRAPFRRHLFLPAISDWPFRSLILYSPSTWLYLQLAQAWTPADSLSLQILPFDQIVFTEPLHKRQHPSWPSSPVLRAWPPAPESFQCTHSVHWPTCSSASNGQHSSSSLSVTPPSLETVILLAPLLSFYSKLFSLETEHVPRYCRWSCCRSWCWCCGLDLLVFVVRIISVGIVRFGWFVAAGFVGWAKSDAREKRAGRLEVQVELKQEIRLNVIRMLDGGQKLQRGSEAEGLPVVEFLIITSAVPSSLRYRAAREASQSSCSSASAAAAPGSAASSGAQIDPDNTSWFTRYQWTFQSYKKDHCHYLHQLALSRVRLAFAFELLWLVTYWSKYHWVMNSQRLQPHVDSLWHLSYS